MPPNFIIPRQDLLPQEDVNVDSKALEHSAEKDEKVPDEVRGAHLYRIGQNAESIGYSACEDPHGRSISALQPSTT